jgi:hypothetical protein
MLTAEAAVPGAVTRACCTAGHAGAGEDNHGIDHDKNWLRFPYEVLHCCAPMISTRTRMTAHLLRPRPPRGCGGSPPRPVPQRQQPGEGALVAQLAAAPQQRRQPRRVARRQPPAHLAKTATY